MVRVLEKTPERMVAEVEAPDPTWLFVLRGHFSYRTILLDGRPVEDFPAQLAFSAVRDSERDGIGSSGTRRSPGGRVVAGVPPSSSSAAAAIAPSPQRAPGPPR